MRVYSIKNEKLGFFNRPIYAENDTEVLSYIQNVLMSDADRALLGLKDDLALYQVGFWYCETGVIEGVCKDLADLTLDDPYCPVKVCDLKEIFDTIPKDLVPRTEREIRAQIKDLYHALTTLKVDKKGNVSYEFKDKETI